MKAIAIVDGLRAATFGNGLYGQGRDGLVSNRLQPDQEIDTVVSPKSKLTKPVKKPKATWVEPTFVAVVEFRDITSEGLLRQSSFKGPVSEIGLARGLERHGTNISKHHL